MKYGDLIHYLWGDGPMHSSAMFVHYGRGGLLVQVPLADTHFNIGLTTPMRGVSPLVWQSCDATCPFNVEYRGEQP